MVVIILFLLIKSKSYSLQICYSYQDTKSLKSSTTQGHVADYLQDYSNCELCTVLEFEFMCAVVAMVSNCEYSFFIFNEKEVK